MVDGQTTLSKVAQPYQALSCRATRKCALQYFVRFAPSVRDHARCTVPMPIQGCPIRNAEYLPQTTRNGRSS
ncbi:hypothetical protein AB395_00006832 (plasmid) [Sinorhizobium fredii CCBAU 45436]|nr:hypothetical protein AB395_00006832 [Sinorhizobium fredii CCBAU 45436]